MYEISDKLNAGTGTFVLANGMDGVYHRQTLQFQSGVPIENSLYNPEYKAVDQTLNYASAELAPDWGKGSPIHANASDTGSIIGSTNVTLTYRPKFSFGKLNKEFHSCKRGAIQVQLEHANDLIASQGAYAASGSGSAVLQQSRLMIRYIDLTPDMIAYFNKTTFFITLKDTHIYQTQY